MVYFIVVLDCGILYSCVLLWYTVSLCWIVLYCIIVLDCGILCSCVELWYTVCMFWVVV